MRQTGDGAVRLVLVLVILGFAGPPPVHAAEMTASYAMKIRGFTVGVARLSSNADTRGYAVTGLIENTGLTRVFRHFSYHGAAQGNIGAARLLPQHYQENADTGRRVTDAELAYDKGVPEVVRYNSPNPVGQDTPDPATQGGTIDPLTAIYSLLRDVPRDTACKLDVMIFDGRRRSRIFMIPATGSGAIPRCNGVYERLQGFTAKELSRNTRFDFVLDYSRLSNDMLRVESIVFDSSYGTAALVRR